MIRKSIILVITLLATVLLLGGCGGAAGSGKDGAYIVTDDTGASVSLPGKPQRIVSLTYGTDEILLEAVAPRRIAALCRWAGDSGITFVTEEQAAEIGRKVQLNTEDIIAARPDLVIGSLATPHELVQTLKDMGIPVYLADNPKNYDRMCSKILGVARAVGEEDQGRRIIAEMDGRMQKLQRKLSALRDDQLVTAVAFNFTGAMGRQGDLLDSMMSLARIRNGAAMAGLKEPGQLLSKEQIVAVDPDIFLLPTWNYDKKQNVDGFADEIRHDPAFANVRAIKNRRLEFVSDRYRYVASQHITDAVEALARAAYPQLF